MGATQPDHRLWETAVLFHLRDAFRAGDLWLARSRRYGDIRKTLLSAPAVVDDADRSLPVPASPQDWLAERKGALDEGLRRLDAAARAGAIAGASIDDGMLRIERTAAAVPDGAGDLVADLYQRIPDTRITDILLEVDDATRFTEAFTHLRTGRGRLDHQHSARFGRRFAAGSGPGDDSTGSRIRCRPTESRVLLTDFVAT